MFAALHSILSSTFVVDYFKDMFLGILLVIYFVVLVLSRPRVPRAPKPASDAPTRVVSLH